MCILFIKCFCLKINPKVKEEKPMKFPLKILQFILQYVLKYHNLLQFDNYTRFTALVIFILKIELNEYDEYIALWTKIMYIKW